MYSPRLILKINDITLLYMHIEASKKFYKVWAYCHLHLDVCAV